ncbi:GNAT family N-acetyltransferase [Pseudoxanthomonas sp. PXM01]|uniref:GNAT family N-acetyltransferase n=1 Tax=Pseudoxanthomonas sp. PXM01 TaxID=2769295 RepID=UPI00178471B5|nr:GNAT family N-acetyltransferase [Pseudoxanthomonas sp. PXM01]MBD9469541.1 GNAT family N-acetyltransferase [Pseudoxanthomonas sp. PXM01]
MSDARTIELVASFPDATTYRRLRIETGLSPKSPEAAERGLANTLYGVSLVKAGEVIGMGRLVGDNGTVFVVVDIAVQREHQGQGLGRRIMAALDAWLRANAPPSAYVMLVADGGAKHLYAQFGFADTAPASIGMAYVARGPGADR